MALQDSFPGVSGKADSTELRKDLAGLIVRDSNGVPRGGIFPRHANALISARSDMKLNVAAFEGVSVRGGGPLFMANDGVALTPLIPIPLANSQTSVVYFKQNESGSPYLDSDDLPVIGIISGAASATPVKPSIAGIAGAEELGTVTVPFDATATNSAGVVVTPTHRFTTTAGGVLPVRTVAEMNGLLAVPDGLRCYVFATGQTFQYIATATIPGWFHAGGRPVLDVISFVGLYMASATYPPKVVTQAGRVSLEGYVTNNATATFNAATQYTIGTVPAALAPAMRQVFTCSWGGTGLASLIVDTDGTLSFILSTGAASVAAGGFTLSISGPSWRAKGL